MLPTSSQQEVSRDPRRTPPKMAWTENSPTDKETITKKSKVVAFFQEKWRAVKRSISGRGNEVVSIHIVQEEDEPQPGPSGLGPAHSGEGANTRVADPSPADQQTKPKKNLWQVVKRAFTVSRRDNKKVSTQPDQQSDKPQHGKPVPQPTLYKRHVFHKRPVPHPSDPKPPRGLYLSDPRPAGFFKNFEERYGSLYRIAGTCHSTEFCGTRISDGKKVGIRYVSKGQDDRFITIPGYDKPLQSELALNVLLSKGPRTQHVEQMYEWFDTEDLIIMIMEDLQPFKTLRQHVRDNKSLLSEDMARKLIIQAVKGEKECLDRGVYHQNLSFLSVLINPETLKLHVTDFHEGTFVGTADISQYSGKGFPVEFNKRARYIAEKSMVWSLGSLLFWMLLGHEPYFNADRKATEELIFEYTVRLTPKPEKKINPIKRALKHVWKTLSKHIYCPQLSKLRPKRRPKGERASLSKECQDLLSRCLNHNEVHRPTLQQILEHEWFRVELEPKPSCPLPKHVVRHRPRLFRNQFEREGELVVGRMFECNRKLDGQKFLIKHIKKSVFDKRVMLREYNMCLDTELALNLVMQQKPRCHNMLMMQNAFRHKKGHLLVFRDPGRFTSLELFIKSNRGRLSEEKAREIMVQAAMAVKDCLDRGVYLEDITLSNFLVVEETHKLLLHNLRKGKLVDTEFDNSQYRGKALPVEFKKRERYMAEASVVRALGRVLYTMVYGGRLCVTKRSSISGECQDLITRCLNKRVICRATLQELLEHEWFRVNLLNCKK